jgi:copper homeostasis protein
MKILEVCVDSLDSARAAIAGGADRIELCSALSIGGLTPYVGLLRQLRRESGIPVRCLMRPRAGDFCYTSSEIELMGDQIRELKAAGANGFVIGCLTPEGDLDEKAMASLMDACGDSGITLHRCVDVSRDPVETCRRAGELGIDTVLTSGAAPNCVAGEAVIARLLELRDREHGPEILIGAGVNAGVITRFRAKYPAARAFHMSGKRDTDSVMIFRRQGIPMGVPGLDEWHIPQTDSEAVRLARKALDA